MIDFTYMRNARFHYNDRIVPDQLGKRNKSLIVMCQGNLNVVGKVWVRTASGGQFGGICDKFICTRLPTIGPAHDLAS